MYICMDGSDFYNVFGCFVHLLLIWMGQAFATGQTLARGGADGRVVKVLDS